MIRLFQECIFKPGTRAVGDGGAGVGYELIQCLEAEVTIAFVLDAARKVGGKDHPAHFHISTPWLA